MATIINAYKTSGYLDAYSKDGSNDDPVFPYPPNSFDGDTGQTREAQLFVKNDGDTYLRNNVATPIDLESLGRETWIKLALTQGGLDSAIAGDPISFSDLDPLDTVEIWERIAVPAGTGVGNVTDLTVRLRSDIFAS